MLSNVKLITRKLLLQALKLTEDSASATTLQRGLKQKLWHIEVHPPTPLIFSLVFLITYFILALEVGFPWYNTVGIGLFLFAIFVGVGFFIYYNKRELGSDSEAMMCLGLIVVLGVLLMALFKEWTWFNRSMSLATPMAAFCILAGLLLSRRIGMVISLAMCLVLAAINDLSFKHFVVHFFGCMTAVSLLHSVRDRSNLTELCMKVAGVNVFVIVAIWLLNDWQNEAFYDLVAEIVFGLFSGVLSAILVLWSLPHMEKFFSRTTNIKLLELADFNRPLLKRLMLEAPGTYHHSLIVASLAEQAAESIGANPLLARVGAYYHDIGKITKPEYFIENQLIAGNPHDPLTPTMSSLVVISHEKEGVALAKSYDIDKVIIDCIEQHHGTSLIHYFYHRALEQNNEVKSENFRYPGPKPKTRESAILMLADSAEAACRAIDEPTPGRIEDTVLKIMNNKFIDGQFSDCPITLHDLSNIAESLVSTLSGIYHARIEYKDAQTKAEKLEKAEKVEDEKK